MLRCWILLIISCLTGATLVHSTPRYNVSVLSFPDGNAPAPMCYLGEAIAMAPDASLAVVGSWTMVDGQYETCSNAEVYVYARNASTGAWSNLPWGTLVEPDGAPGEGQVDEFGRYVAINTVARSILVSAECINSCLGAVFAYSAVDGTFEQLIVASDGVAGDGFGSAIATAAYTPLAIVAAEGYQSGTGEAYVLSFHASTRSWNITQTLRVPGGSLLNEFGSSVAMSGSGVVAIVGALNVNDAAGAAYIFERSANGTFMLQATLDAPAWTPEFFGVAVAISEDVAAVAANFNAGAVCVYSRSGGGVWTLNQTLTLNDTTNTTNMNEFGCSVALSTDGRVLVVGACQMFGLPLMGAAFAFTRNASGVWTQLLPMTPPPNPTYAVFGSAVATNADGSIWMVGAPTLYNAGSVYAYTLQAMSSSDV